MSEKKIQYKHLEKHETKSIVDDHVNGSLTVVWRDWDKEFKINPKMIYITSINPGEIKGPHLHLKRNSYFVCIKGKILFIIQQPNKKYLEIESSEDDPVMIYVPKNFTSAHINLTNEVSTILTIADLSWKPNDNEMKNILFTDYDWSKWKNFVK